MREQEASLRTQGTASGRPGLRTVVVTGFWRRFGAAAIDMAIIGPCAALLVYLAGRATGIHLPSGSPVELDFWIDLVLASDPALHMIAGLFAGVGAVYLLVFHITAGRTLGMRALGLRVIDVYGDRPSMPRCLLRTAGYFAAAATLLLGFVWIGFDSEKRGLHDWLAGTYVIRG